MALEPHIAAKLDTFLAGADLRRDDPRMADANTLQRLGLVSARPVECAYGWQVQVRVTPAGYAALARS